MRELDLHPRGAFWSRHNKGCSKMRLILTGVRGVGEGLGADVGDSPPLAGLGVEPRAVGPSVQGAALGHALGPGLTPDGLGDSVGVADPRMGVGLSVLPGDRAGVGAGLEELLGDSLALGPAVVPGRRVGASVPGPDPAGEGEVEEVKGVGDSVPLGLPGAGLGDPDDAGEDGTVEPGALGDRVLPWRDGRTPVSDTLPTHEIGEGIAKNSIYASRSTSVPKRMETCGLHLPA